MSRVTGRPRPQVAVPDGPPGLVAFEGRGLRRRWIPESLGHSVLWATAVVVAVGPLVPVVVASLWSTPLYESGGRLTLRNYQGLFTDASWWHAVLNTCAFALLSTAIAVVAGTVLAVLLNRTDVPGRRVYGVLLMVPIVLPGLVQLLGWSIMWSPFGYGSTWLAAHTPFHIPFSLNGIVGMSIVGATVTTPIVYFLARGVLLNADTSLEEAARSCGARPLRALWSATVPLLRPSVLNSSVLVLALGLEVLGLPLILGKSSGIEMIGTYLYRNWIDSMPPRQGLVSAGAVVLLAVVSILLLVRNRLAGDTARFVSVTGKPRGSATLSLGPVRWVISALLAVVLTFTTIAPAIGVLLAAFTRILSPFLNPFDTFTTGNFTSIWQNASYSRSIADSLLIAAVGGAVMTVVVGVLSLVAHRSRFRLRGSLQQAMMWPRTVPGLVTGMGFFWAFVVLDKGGGFRSSLWALGLAFAIRHVALAYSAFYPALAGVGADMERAARVSGSGWWRAAVGIVLRLVRPALAVSFVLLFVSLLNEYEAAVFLVTPEHPVMGLTMLQLSNTGVSGGVAAFGVIQMALTFGVLGLGRLIFGVRAHV